MFRDARLGLLLVLGAALFAPGAAGAGPPNLPPRPNLPDRFVCAAPGQDATRCHARVVTDAGGTPLASSGPVGYGPAQFQTAYGLPSASAGSGQTIGIVDAYDDPTAEKDLGTYGSTFGLPACTTANGCFKKVNQTGGTTYPKKNGGWALEISLDVQIAHAVCPNCKILLVEASSNSFTNLLTAEDYATSHANVVSNSWGGGESSSETGYDSHFNRPGVPITVSSGDNGYGVEYPAASQYVTAVGGTTLNLNANNTRSSETAWSGAGSGCSAYEAKPLLAARQRLRAADRRRCLRRRGSEHGRRRLRLDALLPHRQLLLHDGLVPGRRDEPRITADRGRLRPRGECRRHHVRVLSLLEHLVAVRRHLGQQRQLRR